MLHESDIDLFPCPLTFYSKKGKCGGYNLPIWYQITSVIIPCSPASGDVERSNSSKGKVLSPSRQSLFSSTVSSIVLLKGFHREQERRRPTHREKVAKNNFQQFVAFMGNRASSLEGIKKIQRFFILLTVSTKGSV
jgi:hypothetical protein